jgi:hypothetical protein
MPVMAGVSSGRFAKACMLQDTGTPCYRYFSIQFREEESWLLISENLSKIILFLKENNYLYRINQNSFDWWIKRYEISYRKRG